MTFADPATDASAGRLLRFGLDLVMDWSDTASCTLAAWRDSRDGVRGELTVRQNGARLSWGGWLLSSTTAREGLVKRLAVESPEIPWRAHLEEAARRFTEAVRVGEPVETLSGQTSEGPALLLPGWLYEGEPTLLYADGDTGKSLTALAFALAMQTGVALPGGLAPVRAVQAAYLDWETTRATLDYRLGCLAAGLGVEPPPILYKRMTRPLLDEIGSLATEFARRHVGFVVVDSKMFAIQAGEGAAFHEPITSFYTALRLFAPAAVLVLNHVTNADARTGVPARPFGGAFAWNGPRLVWEAKRDPEVEDATAVVFTCRKANNLLRKPDPFGLRFGSADSASGQVIRVTALNLAEASPQTLVGANLTARIKAMLSEPLSVEALVEALHAKAPSVSRILRRLRGQGVVASTDDGRWLLAAPESGHSADTVRGQVSAPQSASTPEGYSGASGGADGHSSHIRAVRLSASAREHPSRPLSDREEPSWITEG